MKRPEAILFDIDDTIIAFSDASMMAWKKCCDDFVIKNNVNFSSNELYDTVVKTRKWYWSDAERNRIGRANMMKTRREVFKHALMALDFSDESVINITADNYSVMQESLWRLFDGLPEAFDKLREIGISMSIITNGASIIQRSKLDRFDVTKYFRYIIIDSEVGVSKPDIGIYKLALDKLSLSPKEVWMIGDNIEWDIEAPQKLGIFSVWNDFENKGLSHNNDVRPDMTVKSINEMVKNILLCES